jgi:hypothetical protein
MQFLRPQPGAVEVPTFAKTRSGKDPVYPVPVSI